MVLNFGKVIATNQGLKLQSEITPSPSTNLQTQNPPGVN
jgi:hypothetical protein